MPNNGQNNMKFISNHLLMRLDLFLTSCLQDKSRTQVQSWIEKGCVTCNGSIQKSPNFKVRMCDIVIVFPPDIVPSHLVAQEINLDVIYENDDLLVINKPAGLVVHPAPGHSSNTLVNALLNYCPLSQIGGVQRPGIVHRLDKETSGLMVVAKNDQTHQALSAQFHDNKTLKRLYHVWVFAPTNPGKGIFDAPIARHPHHRQKMAIVKNGKRAVTHYQCEKIWKGKKSIARLGVTLETGRTHQIRVHLAHKGLPVIGDPVYGRNSTSLFFPRQALHASELSFLYKNEALTFQSPWPLDLVNLERTINDLAL